MDSRPVITQNLDPLVELAKHNILWFSGEVNAENCLKWSSQLLLASARDQETDLLVILNSPGGSITDGLGLYDLAHAIPNDIAIIGTGMCASMGQFFLTCLGTKGKRFILPNARVLMHQPLGGLGGTSTDIVIQSNLINSMKRQLASLTAERTGKTVEQIMEDGEHDRWFDAAEALEYGFVDHIVKDFTQARTIINGINKDKNLENAK